MAGTASMAGARRLAQPDYVEEHGAPKLPRL